MRVRKGPRKASESDGWRGDPAENIPLRIPRYSIAAANDDRLQEPYRRALIPDYDAIRKACLAGGAKTLWISGSGSTLMAVTDDTIVAKFLQVRLREQFPACETHILACDTEGAQIEYL